MLARNERPILIVNLLYISVFTAMALRHSNYEFVLYAGVVIAIVLSILAMQSRIRFDRAILWGLSIWGLLHMAGGNLAVGDGVLYEVMLIPLIPSHDILRYDQVVHFFGFGVATLVCHHLLRPYLRTDIGRRGLIAVLIVLMGSGLGAVNEILEFMAVIVVPETGVGGYTNTLLDLVFNLAGAVAAVLWLACRGALQGDPKMT
jgi:uncharacterized membrane protein YjdF